jgi:hypothetical protein
MKDFLISVEEQERKVECLSNMLKIKQAIVKSYRKLNLIKKILTFYGLQISSRDKRFIRKQFHILDIYQNHFISSLDLLKEKYIHSS